MFVAQNNSRFFKWIFFSGVFLRKKAESPFSPPIFYKKKYYPPPPTQRIANKALGMIIPPPARAPWGHRAACGPGSGGSHRARGGLRCAGLPRPPRLAAHASPDIECWSRNLKSHRILRIEILRNPSPQISITRPWILHSQKVALFLSCNIT